MESRYEHLYSRNYHCQQKPPKDCNTVRDDLQHLRQNRQHPPRAAHRWKDQRYAASRVGVGLCGWQPLNTNYGKHSQERFRCTERPPSPLMGRGQTELMCATLRQHNNMAKPPAVSSRTRIHTTNMYCPGALRAPFSFENRRTVTSPSVVRRNPCLNRRIFTPFNRSQGQTTTGQVACRHPRTGTKGGR